MQVIKKNPTLFMFSSHVIKTLFGTKVGQSLKFALAIFTPRDKKKKGKKKAAQRHPDPSKERLATLAKQRCSKSRPHIHTSLVICLLHVSIFLRQKLRISVAGVGGPGASKSGDGFSFSSN